MRLLCDRMLLGLARWTHAAGHDTAVVESDAQDPAVLARAASERRRLVTRARALAERNAGAILLTGDTLDEQAAALVGGADLDWLQAPFTRCLVDNQPLRTVEPDRLPDIPDSARSLSGPFRTCPECGRSYWPGSHMRRMRARLERWATAKP